MDNVIFMQISNSFNNLSEQILGIILGVATWWLFSNEIKDFLTVNKIHYNMDILS